MIRWMTAVCLLALWCSGCGSGGDSPHSTAATRTAALPTTARSPAPPGPGAWLGLNLNSSAVTGSLDYFSARGIVYDRSGYLEPAAGETIADTPKLARGVSTSLRARMIPDVEIDPSAGPTGCQSDPNGSTLCLPSQAAGVDAYVTGFIKTASSIRRAHPRARILFEPMNEPWNWPSPAGTQASLLAAREYAAMLARLLPAAKRAGIPASEIYVPATGNLSDGTFWVPDLYRAQPCLRPGRQSCGPIEAWNIHPYGPPGSTSEGIGTVPGIRSMMLSGRANIVISEIGFCSRDVDGGAGCDENSSDYRRHQPPNGYVAARDAARGAGDATGRMAEGTADLEPGRGRMGDAEHERKPHGARPGVDRVRGPRRRLGVGRHRKVSGTPN